VSVTNEERVGLPPLSASKRSTWERYRIEFLADGYPGRRSEGAVLPHPAYGTYVIGDYVTQYRQTHDRSFLAAAARVADAAVDRMEMLEDALVLRYKPYTGASPASHDFYSALTQSRYLAALGQVDAATGDGRFAEAGEAILRSLTLPADQGGVARQTPSGRLVIEEYSRTRPEYALSGWASATTLIHEYAESTGSDQARDVARDSTRGIAEMLPLYDVPEVASSRERLSGQAHLRLSFQNPGARVLGAWVDMPHQGHFPIEQSVDGHGSNHWVSGVEEDGRLGRTTAALDVNLCRVTWPSPHSMHFEVDVPDHSRYALKIGEGRYDPLTSVLPVDDWAVVVRGDLQPGRNVLDIPVPWHQADLVAYPTSFSKVIDGKHHNVHHFTHVDLLRKLHRTSPHPMLEYYHHRWASYPQRWPFLPEYQTDISLERHGR
jgi:hypothetical protein